MTKKIAIIGSGISGLACAHYLQNKYAVTVYEKNDYVGGHTATKQVQVAEGEFNIDTGFIVFNNWTYPNFIRLINELGVASIDTEMGFSVSCENTGLEYSGASLATMFAQKRNWFNPVHWKFIFDIVKFNRVSKERLAQGTLPENLSLGDYIQELGLSQRFVKQYLIPMGAAIWSSGLAKMYEFPALYFIRFFKNHGLLNIDDRPQWAVIKGGSKAYVDAILQQAKFDIRLSQPVSNIKRSGESWQLTDASGEMVEYEHVIFACHSDEAAALLDSVEHPASSVLQAIAYQANEVVLHTDTSLLPRKQSTWSSWNYRLKKGESERATLSYSMNILQRLNCDTQFVVTLNDTANIDPKAILGRYQYAHPVYDRGTLAAQSKRSEINGNSNLWFCGAYWYAGFHEDGIRSALDVVNQLGESLEIL
ncbi:MAG: FAD-dependent oxidoreductase [Gammaproteobacteria bacterium]|nr:FAD-dependent oxidoreductase [Gammaproteobacteria bacterium]